MILELAVISILVGLIRRGSLRNLGNIPVRHIYVFALSLLILPCVFLLMHVYGRETALPFVRAANIVQYVLLLIAVVLNLHIKEMRLAALGVFFQFLVIVANGGVMPVSKWAIRAAGVDWMFKLETTAGFVRHSIMGSDTRLWFLGDIIPIPGEALKGIIPIPALINFIKEVASIGDVFIAIAVFIIIQHYMLHDTKKLGA